MAEPTNINIVYTETDYTPPAGSFKARAVQNTNTTIGPGYNLRWTHSNITQTGFTLTVAYLSGDPLQVDNSESDPIPFDVRNVVFNNPGGGQFFKIDPANPITVTFKNIATQVVIPNNTITTSDLNEQILVEFNANFKTSENFAPTNPYINVTGFNNEPFVRSLTANLLQDLGGSVYVQPSGGSTVKWTCIPSTNVWATYPDGTPLPLNTSLPASAVLTVFFYLTASTYDHTTEAYTLCSTDITVTSDVSNDFYTYTRQYDTFPDINLNVFANYENTGYSKYFYRLISPTPYSAILSSTSNIQFGNTNFTSSYYKGQYLVENILYNSFTPTVNINRSTASAKTVSVIVSAKTPPTGLTYSNWYSPHVFSNTLTSVFVTSFLSANFIGYPGSVFITNTLLEFLNPTNYLTYSKGMFFYGEGHTDYIYLCAAPVNTTPSQYIWEVKNATKTYPVSSWPSLNQPLTSVFVKLTSESNTNTVIPVSLHVTGGIFTSADPIYYFDDTTGIRKYYPYYISTLEPDGTGNENSTNSRFRESIRIEPYDPVIYTFNPGFNVIEPNFLPATETVTFEATLLTDTTTNAFTKCADKYGELWKWSTFEDCDSFINRPSTWSSVSCAGPFPKKWRPEGLIGTVLNPLNCFAGPVTWSLSSSTGWPAIPEIQDSNLNYLFDLRVEDFGLARLSVSFYSPTQITLKAEQTVSCRMSAENTDPNNLILSNDWLTRDTLISVISTGIMATLPSLRLYTPNRFVLTGTNVQFENLITQKELITGLQINFDNEFILNVTQQNLDTNLFYVTGFNVVGDKDITITAFTTYSQDPFIVRLPKAVTVLPEYDTVDSQAYRLANSALDLPWKEAPVVGSNDWATSDNINSCFKKLIENLDYLELCSKRYTNKNTTYYGYLATPPTSAFSATGCLFWTWADVNPFITSLTFDTPVTWRSVLSSDIAIENGEYLKCGKWIDHTRGIDEIIPNCFQKYNLEWSWRSRKKANTSTLVTWQSAKCNQVYAKRWYYEPGTFGQFVVGCDEGYWHNYLPGFDRYYQTIANPIVQQRCLYTGVASKNNILYTTLKTQIKLLSSNFEATYYDTCITSDGVRQFSSIKNICLNSNNTIYVLDGVLNQVIAYNYEPQLFGDSWKLFTNWGGFGGKLSKTGFNEPNDIHIDQLDNVWVTDTGNNAVKYYSSIGTWINTITDNLLLSSAPISVAVDNERNVHILTNDRIYVYSYTGEYQYSYEFKQYVAGTPRKIITSYNREVIYLATNQEIIKFFRNGVYYNTVFKDLFKVNNINGLCHDEYRNLIVITDDKIIKYTDMMHLDLLKGDISQTVWQPNTIYINQDEYVQSWVYTKAFQRMWDNIEYFRNSLYYNNTRCKSYVPPVHNKEKMILGQNEIVTAATINRNLVYLWENFVTLLRYFDPSCEENILL